MNRSTWEVTFPTVSLDHGQRWPVERHVQLRVEYVVNQVARAHAGESAEAVARIINDRLRGLGVTPVARQVQQYAKAIAELPPSPPPPRNAA